MAGYDRYFYSNANHEAAYDSLLTAKILIRMSAFLEADGDYVDVPDDMRQMLADNPDALGKSLRARKSDEARARQEAKCSPMSEPLPHKPTNVTDMQGKIVNYSCDF